MAKNFSDSPALRFLTGFRGNESEHECNPIVHAHGQAQAQAQAQTQEHNKEYRTKRLPIMLPPSLYVEVRRTAQEMDVSMNELVLQAIHGYLREQRCN